MQKQLKTLCVAEVSKVPKAQGTTSAEVSSAKSDQRFDRPKGLLCGVKSCQKILGFMGTSDISLGKRLKMLVSVSDASFLILIRNLIINKIIQDFAVGAMEHFVLGMGPVKLIHVKPVVELMRWNNRNG